MHADSTFVIGDAHKVCQDYALHYPGATGIAYGLVSDGCSSSPMTDVGARLLVLSAEMVIRDDLWLFDRLDREEVEKIVTCADRIRRQMFLPETCLDATLLGFFSRGGKLTLFGIGDGVLALKRPLDHDLIVLQDLESDSGYPLYPSYLLNNKRLQEVEKLGGWRVQGHAFYDPSSGWGREGVDIYNGFGIAQSTGDYLKGLQVAAVFSDGVKSFMDERRNPIPFQDVVKELLDFKSFKGDFVKRRVQGFLKDAAKKGWKHDDDLSMAAVYLGEK